MQYGGSPKLAVEQCKAGDEKSLGIRNNTHIPIISCIWDMGG